MSKNLSRKGIAFGAIVALGTTLFAGAPASANGLADTSFVSLAPSTGTSYSVLAGAGKTFSLSANEASTIVGGNMKFLVSDPSETLETTSDTSGRASISVDQTSGATFQWVTSTDRLTINVNGTGLAVGDRVSFSHAIANGATVYIAANTPVSVTAVTGTSSVTFQAAANAAADVSSNTALDGTDATSKVVREAKNTTDKNFVVDSGSASAGSNSTLVLSTTEATVVTRSVTVRAWVDSNGNDVIDTTEYTSPTRTVQFIKGSEVTATTALDPIVVGSTSVVARVTTVPLLNGQQMSNGDVDAMVTFQGSSVEFDPAAGASVFNTTSNVWVVTATRTGAISAGAEVASDASVLTSAAHGLTNGESITVAGLAAATGTTTGLNGTKTVAAATTDTFRIAAGSGTGAVTPTSATWTVRIVAGSYSARAKIGSDYLQAAATSGTAATVTTTAGAAAITQNVNTVSTVSSGNATATLRPGTLAASATWTFKDTNGAVVSAGRPVKVTVSTLTGVTGLKINGTAVVANDVIDLTTDAAGTATAALTATAAVDTNSVVLTGVAEGVAGSSKTATFNWTTATNTLYDLNATSSVYRSIAKGGSYTFNFAVTDTFKQLVAGSFRLKVATSGNTVSETYTAIAAGTASVTVTDAQISSTGDITVVVTPQKLQTDGTWGTTGAPSAITYYLKPVAQTGGKVTAITSGASAAFSTTAVVAGDTRNSQTAVTADGTPGTDAVEVTGVVTNALTGVVVPGAAVTVSGASNLLFIDGEKAALGSLVVYADANGAYSVHVRSNAAAVDTLVTASALGASSTALKITFTKAARDTGKTLTITAPTYVKPGSTAVVTVSLKDALGNAVVTDPAAAGYVAGSTAPTTTVTYTGPGFVTATIPALTDANGEIKFVILMGANDAGSGVITAAYDSNGATANVAGTTLVASATAIFALGEAPAAGATAKVSGSTKRFFLSVDGNSSAKNVVVKVAGKTFKTLKGSTAKKTYVVAAPKGSHKVTVYVGGKLIATKTITVK